MDRFYLKATIADVDLTVAGEPLHPAEVLVLDLGEWMVRVILPAEISREHFAALAVGTPVVVHASGIGPTWLVAATVTVRPQ
jgi:hypothetical protein